MKKFEQPKRVVTEITITNVKEVHEGRIDAILEFNDSRYGLIDWKTNDINKGMVGGTDRWQLIANFLLANYRYTGDENNWGKCFFGSIVYYEGAYIPRLPMNEDSINKVKNDRRTIAIFFVCILLALPWWTYMWSESFQIVIIVQVVRIQH